MFQLLQKVVALLLVLVGVEIGCVGVDKRKSTGEIIFIGGSGGGCVFIEKSKKIGQSGGIERATMLRKEVSGNSRRCCVGCVRGGKVVVGGWLLDVGFGLGMVVAVVGLVVAFASGSSQGLDGGGWWWWICRWRRW